MTSYLTHSGWNYTSYIHGKPRRGETVGFSDKLKRLELHSACKC